MKYINVLLFGIVVYFPLRNSLKCRREFSRGKGIHFNLSPATNTNLYMAQPNLKINSIDSELMKASNEQFKRTIQTIFASQTNKNQQVLLVLVGIPGCGKSTFSLDFINNTSGWVRVCQDEMKTRQKTINAAIKFLEKGNDVIHGLIVDRCNFDSMQRKRWINLAKEKDAIPMCVVLRDADNVHVCTERALQRGDDGVHTGKEDWNHIVRRMGQQFDAPRLEEGFAGIYWCEERGGGSADEVQALFT